MALWQDIFRAHSPMGDLILGASSPSVGASQNRISQAAPQAAEEPSLLMKGVNTIGEGLALARKPVDILASAAAGLPDPISKPTSAMELVGEALLPRELHPTSLIKGTPLEAVPGLGLLGAIERLREASPELGAKIAAPARAGVETVTDLATNPLTFASFGSGALGRAASAGLAGVGAVQAAQGAKQASDILRQEGATPEALEAATSAGLGVGMAGLGLKHALRGPQAEPANLRNRAEPKTKPAIPKEAKTLEPLPAPEPAPRGGEQRLGERRQAQEPIQAERRIGEDRRAVLAEELGLDPEHPAISRLTQAEERVVAAETDPLTGLGGRGVFERDLATHEGALASFDVEGLKYINDSLGGGHPGGDAMLRALGEAIKSEEGIRGYRTGGDEFYILANSPEAAEAAASSIRERFHNATFRVTLPTGEVVEYTGGRVSHGTAVVEPGAGERAKLAADTELTERRQIAADLGKRVARGSRPLDLAEVAPSGEQVRSPLATQDQPEAVAQTSKLPQKGTVVMPSTYSKPPAGPKPPSAAQSDLATRQAELLKQSGMAPEDFALTAPKAKSKSEPSGGQMRAPAPARASIRPTRAFDQTPTGGGEPPKQAPPTAGAPTSPPSRGERLKEGALSALNLPRSLLSSIDMSAPLRQGLVLTVAHPGKAARAFGEMVKSFSSQGSFDRLKGEVLGRAGAEEGKQAGLYLSMEEGAGLASREEAFASKLIKHIPGVRGSERAYSAYLDKLRSDVFDSTLKAFKEAGRNLEEEPELAKSLATYINHATGRGDLGSLNSSALLLNSIFFSPRFMAARLRMFDPSFYAKMDPSVRRKAVGDMMKLAGAGIGLISLAKLGGAEVESDPRASDFGKLRFGKTRIDPWGGFQPWVRFAAQLGSGERKTLSGGIKKEPRLDIVGRFASQKLSPTAGLIVDMLRGKTSIGEDVSFDQEAYQRLVPLFIQDMVEASKENPDLALGGGLAAFFGAGMQTYDAPQQGTKFERFLKEELERLGYNPEEPSPRTTVRGKSIELTVAEQRVLKKSNMKAADEARRFIRSPLYRRLSDEEREYRLKGIFERWRSKGHARIRSDVQARYRKLPKEGPGPAPNLGAP